MNKFFQILFILLLLTNYLFAEEEIDYKFYLKSTILQPSIKILNYDSLDILKVRLKWQKVSKTDSINIEGTDKKIPWTEPIVESVYEMKRQRMKLNNTLRINKIDKRKYKDSLKPTKYICADSSEIKKLCLKIIEKEKDSYKAVLRIWDWIYRNIQYDETAEISDAKSIILNKKADFAGFSILFSSLARSVGIPVIMNYGIKYNGNEFIFFSWVNVFVGRWISIDITKPGIEINPTYITFYQGDEKIFSEAVNILDIEVIQ